MFFETSRLALRAISRNLLRSFLTVLGVVIGVAAVIAMVTIGNGTTEQVKSELSRLGTNMLFVRPGQFGPGRASTEAKRFDDRDVERIFVAGEQALFPIRGHVDGEALLHQLFAQALAKRRFVFDDQGTHQRILPVAASMRTVMTRPFSDRSLSTYTLRPSSSCTSVRTTRARYCCSARRTASSSEMPSRRTSSM